MGLYAFDGTLNQPDTDDDGFDKNTNVYNFLRFFGGSDERAREALETYEAGVGTRLGAPGLIVGGFFGAGGRTRVKEMVESFKENWLRNGPEDRQVDVIGFSRGAALALHFCNALAKGVKIGAEVVRPPIRFLGLWDVVPAFGLPGIVFGVFNRINIRWDLGVPDTVQHCWHAMALDERRQAFTVYRLDPENDDGPRIQEWWFRGVHSDVGGGNGNIKRSHITLVWMLERAAECGLPIAVGKLDALRAQCDLDAPVSHSSMQGVLRDRIILPNDRIHPSAGREMRIGERVVVKVDSGLWFDFSRVIVSEGGSYRFLPDPNDRWTDKTIECSASGWPEQPDGQKSVLDRVKYKALTSRVVGLARRVPGANWFELIASVGTNGKIVVPVGHGQHVETPWRSPSAGGLFFFANDARLSAFGHDFYTNNKGSVRVTVERVG